MNKFEKMYQSVDESPFYIVVRKDGIKLVGLGLLTVEEVKEHIERRKELIEETKEEISYLEEAISIFKKEFDEGNI